jgi:hypothetical protein
VVGTELSCPVNVNAVGSSVIFGRDVSRELRTDLPGGNEIMGPRPEASFMENTAPRSMVKKTDLQDESDVMTDYGAYDDSADHVHSLVSNNIIPVHGFCHIPTLELESFERLRVTSSPKKNGEKWTRGIKKREINGNE